MDFFEKLTKKASETYKTAAEKTNKLANETKLKLKMNDCKSKINDLYKEIGRKVYEKYTLDGNLDIKADIETELNNIQSLVDEIKSCEKQMLELSNIKECINCNSQMEMSARFCPVCGAEQPEIVKAAEVVETAEEVKATDVPENVGEESNAEETAENAEEIVAEVVLEDKEETENTETSE